MSLDTALRREPKQDRSDSRVHAIVEAARAHYAEVGPDEFTIAPIAAAVGCSSATVFRYFNRNQLLHLVEQHNESLRDQEIRQTAQGSLRARSADKTTALKKILALLGSD